MDSRLRGNDKGKKMDSRLRGNDKGKKKSKKSVVIRVYPWLAVFIFQQNPFSRFFASFVVAVFSVSFPLFLLLFFCFY